MTTGHAFAAGIVRWQAQFGRHDLPWQGTLPAAGHVRVTVESPTAAAPLTAEAIVLVR